jgi:hypothetical protein
MLGCESVLNLMSVIVFLMTAQNCVFCQKLMAPGTYREYPHPPAAAAAAADDTPPKKDPPRSSESNDHVRLCDPSVRSGINGTRQLLASFVEVMVEGLCSSDVFTAVPRALLRDVSREAKRLHLSVQAVLPSCMCLAVAGEDGKWKLAVTLNPKHPDHQTDTMICARAAPVVAMRVPEKIVFFAEDVQAAVARMDPSAIVQVTFRRAFFFLFSDVRCTGALCACSRKFVVSPWTAA